MTTLNMEIALRAAPTAEAHLAACDIVAHNDFFDTCAAGAWSEACQRLLAHLARTETMRRRIHGHGPTWTEAVAAFNTHPVVTAHLGDTTAALFPVRGVNDTPAGSLLPADTGSKDTPKAAYVTAAGAATDSPARALLHPAHAGAAHRGHVASCAPDGPTHLQLVPPADPDPECGHVSETTGMVCVREPHADDNPGGHYYRSSRGSWVPDRHGASS